MDDKHLIFFRILSACSKGYGKKEILCEIGPDHENAELWLELLVKYNFICTGRYVHNVYEITPRGREFRELLESFEKADSRYSLSAHTRHGCRFPV